jgi:hypothetical protein
MLVELGLVEQRLKAVNEVLDGSTLVAHPARRHPPATRARPRSKHWHS